MQKSLKSSTKKMIRRFFAKISNSRGALNRSFGANCDFEIRQVPPEVLSGSRDDLISHAKEWRAGIDDFCSRFDESGLDSMNSRPVLATRGCRLRKSMTYNRRSNIHLASATIENIRVQTMVYRDELKDLKSEARFLKDERNYLIQEMQKISEPEVIEKVIHNPKRRKSISTPYRVY